MIARQAALEKVLDGLPARASGVADRFDPVAGALKEVVTSHSTSDLEIRQIGTSEEGRAITGILAGCGTTKVSLIAGNHADEPLGSQTLLRFVALLASSDAAALPLLEAFTFAIIPHTNPDGEARNRQWMDHWPDPVSFERDRVRELPGRDVEFGFPDMRPENRAVANFLRRQGPFHMHMSLHGMAYATGALLMVDRRWAPHSESIQRSFVEAAESAGLGVHDQNRKGEKGFFYLGPGLWTTPEGESMRDHFTMVGDLDTAARFRDSSMEFVSSLGGRPLCLVTEIPLFLVRGGSSGGREADAYGRFRDELAEWRARGFSSEGFRHLAGRFSLRAVPVSTGMQLQLEVLARALRQLLVVRN